MSNLLLLLGISVFVAIIGAGLLIAGAYDPAYTQNADFSDAVFAGAMMLIMAAQLLSPKESRRRFHRQYAMAYNRSRSRY